MTRCTDFLSVNRFKCVYREMCSRSVGRISGLATCDSKGISNLKKNNEYNKTTINGHKYSRKQISLPDGRRKSLYAKNDAELRRKEVEFRQKLNSNECEGDVSVEAYAKRQLELMRPQIASRTYAGYESKVRSYIIPLLGQKRLKDVRPDDIRYVLSQVSTQSASSYGKVHMLLRQIFKAAKANRFITYDPTEGVSSKGGKPQSERPALTDEQVSMLLAAVQGLRVETFIRIALYSGLRREEILALQWDCVHLEETPYLEVRRAWRVEHNRPVISDVLKTASAKRNVPIPSQLSEHLCKLKAISKSRFVICNNDNEPLSETQWRNLWKKVSVRTASERTYTRYSSGKKKVHKIVPVLGTRAAHNPEVVYSLDFRVTPHQLRHTYVTHLVFSGCDPKTVQYLAGHCNSRVTLDVYSHVKYNRPEELSSMINSAFKE